jgi:TolB-like protein
VHRDIKPENILLSGVHAIVADFGVARAIDTARLKQITRTGPGSPGTPAYMSPEQLLGDKDVDQRSDIYSLGCLLYEMLTGKAPFAGKDGFVRRFTEPPPSAGALRPELPRHIDEIIAKALATEPAGRFQTAREFARELERAQSGPLKEASPPAATGLESATVAPPVLPVAPATEVAETPREETPATMGAPSPPRRVSARIVGAVAAAVVLILAAVHFAPSRRAASLDDNLLAVAPFRVVGTDTMWREGLTDLLVVNLDGAGQLRTVSAENSLQHWNGYSDAASAENLGRAVHARFVVFGDVIGAGVDSVRVTVSLLDARAGRALAELHWKDASAHIDRLTDSVTLGILRQIGEEFGMRSLSHVSLGTMTTLPALKEFLVGEQYLRRTAWDSALAAYTRATQLDSNFALALWRVGVVQSWRRREAEFDDHYLRAGIRNHGLGPRDSLLIAGDYLFAEADTATGSLHTWKFVPPLHSTMLEATRRYPDDAEAWFQRGDALFHFAPKVGDITSRDLLDIFLRGIAADSAFAPSYLHAIELALQVGEDSIARRLIAAYLALEPSDFGGEAARLVAALHDHGPSSPEPQRLLGVSSHDALLTAFDMVALFPDSAESAVAVGRQVLAREDVRTPGSERWDARLRLARELAFRGHLRYAYRELARAGFDTLSTSLRAYGELAMLGIFPRDSVLATMGRWRSVNPLSLRWLLPWLARERDTSAIRQLGRDAALQATVTRDPIRSGNAAYTIASTRAYLALARGDTTGAARLFEALPDSLCALCFPDRLLRIQVVRLAGAARDAARYAREQLSREYSAAYVLHELEEARIARQLGDSTNARRIYQRVLATWRHADPELEPYVREARDAIGLPRR